MKDREAAQKWMINLHQKSNKISVNTYLLEIGLEEMPAQMILPAVEQLKSLAQKTREKQRLNFNDLKLIPYQDARQSNFQGSLIKKMIERWS